MQRTLARLIGAVALPLALIAVAATPAAAHDDAGTLTLTRAEQVGPTSVLVEVGIVFDGDGHLAEEAGVTAMLTSNGASVGPTPLAIEAEGTSLYSATIEVPGPGNWSVQVTSTNPAGSTSGSVTVSEQVPDSSPDAASGPGSDDTATTAQEGSGSVESQSATDPAPVTATHGTSTDDGTSTTVIIAASLILAAIVIGGAFLVAMQRSRKDAAP